MICFVIFCAIMLILQTTAIASDLPAVSNEYNGLYNSVSQYFENTEFKVYKMPQGFKLKFVLTEEDLIPQKITPKLYKNICFAGKFLAKIKNPVIIEVRTNNVLSIKYNGLKNWELSTLTANGIENLLLDLGIETRRIKSVGFGEFYPEKNTPNNGSKKQNEVDIIVLCNINGE